MLQLFGKRTAAVQLAHPTADMALQFMMFGVLDSDAEDITKLMTQVYVH